MALKLRARKKQGLSFTKAKIMYGSIIHYADVKDENIKNKILWAESDHWRDNDNWFRDVAIPQAEILESQLKQKNGYVSVKACEQATKIQFENQLISGYSAAAKASADNWDFGDHDIDLNGPITILWMDHLRQEQCLSLDAISV